jgi:Mce-associated membrane protein
MADDDDARELRATDTRDVERRLAAAKLAEAKAIEAEAELRLARARTALAEADVEAQRSADTTRTRSAASPSSTADADGAVARQTTSAPVSTAAAEPEDTAAADATDPPEVRDTDTDTERGDVTSADRHRTGRSRLLAAAVVTTLLALIVAGGGLSIYLFQKHDDAEAETARRTAYVQAARQGVLNILSVDHNHADADIKRILDNATGKWQEEFSPQAQPFVDVVKQAKVITTAAISGAGLEKVNPDDSAQVLVAASAKVTNSSGAQEEPRTFRVRVTVAESDGQLKVSNMEYIAS